MRALEIHVQFYDDIAPEDIPTVQALLPQIGAVFSPDLEVKIIPDDFNAANRAVNPDPNAAVSENDLGRAFRSYIQKNSSFSRPTSNVWTVVVLVARMLSGTEPALGGDIVVDAENPMAIAQPLNGLDPVQAPFFTEQPTGSKLAIRRLVFGEVFLLGPRVV